MTKEEVTVCVDVMGGDVEPSVILQGIEEALNRDPHLNIIAVGDSGVVEPFANQHQDRVKAVVSTEVIEMDDHPAEAMRKKRDSSIVVGCKQVKQGSADAIFSAGSTGATLAAATLYIGRIKGVKRPALFNPFPTSPKEMLFGDLGANADVTPEFLLQFSQMGAVYAREVMGVANPQVALLNIGSESTKGSEAVIEAYKLLEENLPEFAGNCEGNDLLTGEYDVIITDGFTGNIVLKTLEGTAKYIVVNLKEAIMSSLKSKLGGLLIKNSLGELRDKLNPDTVGGAQLMGIKGVVVVGHGKSNPRAVMNGIEVCSHAVRAGLVEKLSQSFATNSK